MPEGHTLHRLARTLNMAFTGTAPRASSPQGRFADSAAELDGVDYGEAYAHGKHLFRARVDPFRPGNEIRRASWDAIWTDLVELMPLGVTKGQIDTLRPDHLDDYRAANPGKRKGRVYAYRRTGQPCYVCGSPIRTEPVAGRNLFWCGRCQRRR